VWKIKTNVTAKMSTFVQDVLDFLDANGVQNVQVNAVIFGVGGVDLNCELTLDIFHSTQQFQQLCQTLCVTIVHIAHVTHQTTGTRLHQPPFLFDFPATSISSPDINAQTGLQHVHFHFSDSVVGVVNCFEITHVDQGQATNHYDVSRRVFGICR
jgi:hypothetical protein